MGSLSYGGFSEYGIAEARKLVALPRATPDMVALLTSGLTASIGLEEAGRMRSGDTVLVTAAAGGYLSKGCGEAGRNAGFHAAADWIRRGDGPVCSPDCQGRGLQGHRHLRVSGEEDTLGAPRRRSSDLLQVSCRPSEAGSLVLAPLSSPI